MVISVMKHNKHDVRMYNQSKTNQSESFATFSVSTFSTSLSPHQYIFVNATNIISLNTTEVALFISTKAKCSD
jgi:hypothetical protein